LLNRGGIPRTRSGFAHTLTFPSGEKLQGCTVFRARQFGDEATDYLVFAVDGNIYSLEFPLVQPSSWADHRLDITMSPDVDMIHMEVCEKTASTNPDGTAVVTPTFSTIIFNDGLSNAAAWDGTDVTIFDEDEQGVPTGTWMKFAGQRLWVAVGNVLVASDFADPLLFRERTSGTVRGDFVFDRDLTGLGISTSADRQEVLLAMTASTTEAFAVSRATRDDWETEGFRSMLYSNIGCVAGRTIIGHAGLTWWRAEEGLVNSDPATTVYVSSQIKTRDVELARSRARWNDDVSGCCSASYGGVFLTAFPYDDTLNSEIGVLDYAVVNEFGGRRIRHGPVYGQESVQ